MGCGVPLRFLLRLPCFRFRALQLLAQHAYLIVRLAELPHMLL
jgi:hypothetical protein